VATRFYLPSSGTSPLPSLAIDSQWEGSASTFYRAPLPTTKTDTALTDKAARFNSTATRQDCWAQFVSEPLTHRQAFYTSDTASIIVRGLEGDAKCDAHIAFVLRLVSGDGSTVRGILRGYMAASTELTTSALTRIISGATFTAAQGEIGDRFVLEVGSHGVTPDVGYDVTWRFGDPTATADFAFTAGLTTDLCPWLDINTATLDFGSPDADARGGNGYGTAVSLTHGLTIAEGDVLEAVVHYNSATYTVADNNGSTPFTELLERGVTSGAATHGYTIYRRVAGASEPATFNFTLSTATNWSIALYRLTGIDGTTPEDVTPAAGTEAASTSDGTTATSTGMTTGSANAVAVAFGMTDDTTGMASPTSPTNSYVQKLHISNYPTTIFSRVVASAGAVGTMSYTLPETQDWTVTLLAAKAAVTSFTGTASATLTGLMSASASGTYTPPAVTGTAAASYTGLQSGSSSGTMTFAGTSAATLTGLLSGESVGSLKFTGTSAATLTGLLAASASGTYTPLAITGTAAATLTGLIQAEASGTYTPPAITGTATASYSGLESGSASGTLKFTGDAAGTLSGVIAANADGTYTPIPVTGTGAATLSGLMTAAAEGTYTPLAITGTAAATLTGLLAAAAEGTAGVDSFTGTAGATLTGLISSSGEAALLFTGTGSSSLTGLLSGDASGTYTPPSVTGSAAGTYTGTESGAATGMLIFTGESAAAMTGLLAASASGTYTPLAITGTASETLTGLIAAVAEGTYTPLAVTGTASAIIVPIIAAAEGAVAGQSRTGTASATLTGLIVGAGIGVIAVYRRWTPYAERTSQAAASHVYYEIRRVNQGNSQKLFDGSATRTGQGSARRYME